MVKSFFQFATIMSGFTLVWGDTMILKSGETLEVEVLDFNEKEYRVIHHFTKGIKEEKTIPAEDVLKVKEGSMLDDAEYEHLQSYLPVPDGKKERYYTHLIEERFEAFLEDFPDSDFFRKVKADIKELKNEREQVTSGAMKYKGQFITEEDVEDQLFDFRAEQIRGRVMSALDNKKILTALREYEGFREGYVNSKAYLKTAKSVNDTLKAFHALLGKKIASPDVEPDEKFYNSLSFNEAQRVKQEFADKKKRIADKIEQDEANGEVWLSIDFSSPSGMEKTKTLVEDRMKELDEWSVSEKIDAGTFYNAAYLAIKVEDLEGAKAAIEEFSSASPPEVLVSYLNNKVSSLEREIKARENATVEEVVPEGGAEVVSEEGGESASEDEVAVEPEVAPISVEELQ